MDYQKKNELVQHILVAPTIDFILDSELFKLHATTNPHSTREKEFVRFVKEKLIFVAIIGTSPVLDQSGMDMVATYRYKSNLYKEYIQDLKNRERLVKYNFNVLAWDELNNKNQVRLWSLYL